MSSIHGIGGNDPTQKSTGQSQQIKDDLFGVSLFEKALDGKNAFSSLGNLKNMSLQELKDLLEKTDDEEEQNLIKSAIQEKELEESQKANSKNTSINKKTFISDEYTNELTELYEALASTKDPAERLSINEKINNVISESTLTQNELMNIQRNQLNSTTSNHVNELGELYEQFNNATDEAVRAELKSQILEISKEFDVEERRMKTEMNNSFSTLPPELKGRLTSLYDSLAETTDKSERLSLTNQIYDIMNENNVDGFESEIVNSNVMLAKEASYSNQLENLYAQLGNTTDFAERTRLNDEISELEETMAAELGNTNTE